MFETVNFRDQSTKFRKGFDLIKQIEEIIDPYQLKFLKCMF